MTRDFSLQLDEDPEDVGSGGGEVVADEFPPVEEPDEPELLSPTNEAI